MEPRKKRKEPHHEEDNKDSEDNKSTDSNQRVKKHKVENPKPKVVGKRKKLVPDNKAMLSIATAVVNEEVNKREKKLEHEVNGILLFNCCVFEIFTHLAKQKIKHETNISEPNWNGNRRKKKNARKRKKSERN
jgi:uncharacterized membrane protein